MNPNTISNPLPIKQAIINHYGSKENIHTAWMSDSDVDNKHRVFERAINNEADWFEVFLSNMYSNWNRYGKAKQFNKEVLNGQRAEAKCYKFQVPYKCYNEKLALANGITKSVAIMSPDESCYMYYDRDFIHGLEKAKETGYFFVDVPKDRKANTYWFRTINHKDSSVSEAYRENLEWTCLFFYYLSFCVENAAKEAKRKRITNNLRNQAKELAKLKAETLRDIKAFQNKVFEQYDSFKQAKQNTIVSQVKVKHKAFNDGYDPNDPETIRRTQATIAKLKAWDD